MVIPTVSVANGGSSVTHGNVVRVNNMKTSSSFGTSGGQKTCKI